MIIIILIILIILIIILTLTLTLILIFQAIKRLPSLLSTTVDVLIKNTHSDNDTSASSSLSVLGVLAHSSDSTFRVAALTSLFACYQSCNNININTIMMMIMTLSNCLTPSTSKSVQNK